MTPVDLVRVLSANPEAFLRIPAGSLAVGQVADVTLADPDRHYDYDRIQAVSRSKNTPFDGWAMQGKIVRTFTAGRQVYEA